MGAHEDTGLQINLFEPSSERGTFSNWAKYGDIPSTHGDIPVVFCLVYEIGFLAMKVFSKFLPTGSIILVAPSFEDAGFTTCTFFMFGFSLDAKKLSILGYNIIQLLLATSSLLDLHTRNIIQMSNDFRGTRPLVNLRSLENVSRRENTVPTPVTCKLRPCSRE